jgi:hypothetical protein
MSERAAPRKPPTKAQPEAKAPWKWLGRLKPLGTLLLGIFGGVVLSPSVTNYFDIGQPDLRYPFEQLPDDRRFRVLTQWTDASGNAIYLISNLLRVRNLAFKRGFVDKVEFVPFSMPTLPKVELLGVDKRPISRGETQTVEVRALVTIPFGLIGPPTESKTLDIEVRLFDNTGRQVGSYTDDRLARMRMQGVVNFTRTIVEQPCDNAKARSSQGK